MKAAPAASLRLLNARTGAVVASSVEVARTSAARRRGLLGRAGLPPGAALMLTRCNAIHTVDPEVVVLGGFLGVLLGHVGDRVEDDVRAQTMAAMTDRLRIVPAALGRDVLVRGAAELGFADLLRDGALPTTAGATAATGADRTTAGADHTTTGATAATDADHTPADREDAVEEARSA